MTNNRLTKQPHPGLALLRQLLGLPKQPNLTGPNWWAWYRQYLQTDQWQRKADRCKARAHHTCKRCKIRAGQIRPDGSRAWLEAHHLSYDRVGNERASDLECLCEDCHREGHLK